MTTPAPPTDERLRRLLPWREREIRENLSTGENADPSCQDCNERLLLSEIDRLRILLTDQEHELIALRAARDRAIRQGEE